VRSGKKARAVHGKTKLTETEKGETDEEQSQEHVHNFFISRGLFTRNSSWQAKQSILRTSLMLDGYCVKMCKDFSANFGNKKTNWLLHHDNAPSHT
jgi:hypothetical protein